MNGNNGNTQTSAAYLAIGQAIVNAINKIAKNVGTAGSGGGGGAILTYSGRHGVQKPR
jgi:hypothetical protein